MSFLGSPKASDRPRCQGRGFGVHGSAAHSLDGKSGRSRRRISEEGEEIRIGFEHFQPICEVVPNRMSLLVLTELPNVTLATAGPRRRDEVAGF
jgi:hypothetical protein